MALRKRAVGALGKAARFSGLGAGFTATAAAATSVGVVSALNTQNMGTYVMDAIDETLTGQTTSDVTYTGAERSITNAAVRGLTGRSFGVPSRKYLNPTISGYANAMGNPDTTSDNRRYTGNSRYANNIANDHQAFSRDRFNTVDGSMVFGMWNLR